MHISELEQRGLIDALGIDEKDLPEAKYNLLGFFKVLYKIDQRLRREKELNSKINNSKK